MIIPVDSDRLGAIAAGSVEPVFPWVEGPDGKRRPGTEQERNDAGVPLWVVHVLLVSGDRPTVIQVRVPAYECLAPVALAPVAFERLEVNARVGRDGKLGTYWSAAGLVDNLRAGHGRSARSEENAA
jgi:hypothetical protein